MTAWLVLALDVNPVGTVGGPTTIDVLAGTTNEGVTDPGDLTVELIDPATGNPVDTLTIPGEGEFAVQPDGNIVFTPEPGFTGETTPVDYQVTDPDGQTSDPATITIDNQELPKATDYPITVTEDTPLTFDPLAHDSDVDGTLDPTSVVFVNPPTGATLSPDGKTLDVPGEGVYVIDPATGEVTFTPEPDFNGPLTTVEYQVADNDGATDIAEIAGSVTPVNDPPIATDDPITVTEDTPLTFDPLANDSGVDGTLDPTSVVFTNPPAGTTLSSDSKTLDVPGEGVYVIDPVTGEITFTLEGNFNGSLTPIEYRVVDDNGEISNSATISILSEVLNNLVEGTTAPEHIIGTNQNDDIAGYKGQDTLTGGEGKDNFLFDETSDGVDLITDFTSGEDKLVLTYILEDELGYTGNDPIADNHIVLSDYGSVGTMVQIDFDGSGDLLPKDVVFLDGISNLDANVNNDFDPNTDLIF